MTAKICPHLPLAELSWDRVEAMAGALTFPLHYLSGPREAYRGGEVQCGWRGRDLFVLARLEDENVFTRATADFQRLWLLGDVFEIFLRDLAGEEYFEFHIAPGGHRQQLGFASTEDFRRLQRGEKSLEDYMQPDPRFDFLMRETPDGWEVFARIPWLGRAEALISFSRYDYDPGRAEPVLSSTSLHQEVSFHRQEEWTKITFGSAPL